MDSIKNLKCACCGGRFIGRQFHNQDTGYGMGDCCADRVKSKMGDAAEFERTYGKEGFNYLLHKL